MEEENTCPQCGVEFNSPNYMKVTDDCGRVKCRTCLAQSIDGCELSKTQVEPKKKGPFHNHNHVHTRSQNGPSTTTVVVQSTPPMTRRTARLSANRSVASNSSATSPSTLLSEGGTPPKVGGKRRSATRDSPNDKEIPPEKISKRRGVSPDITQGVPREFQSRRNRSSSSPVAKRRSTTTMPPLPPEKEGDGDEDDDDGEDPKDPENAEGEGDVGELDADLDAPSKGGGDGEGARKKNRNPLVIPNHISVLDGDPPMYQCNVCQKKFKTKAHTKYHGFCQKGDKPFKCEQCGQGFISKSHYEYHLRTHTGERPYVCPECGKGFNQQGKVTRHMRSHTGEKPFICQECNRGFASAQALRSHIFIHTGELPFACTYCNKRFAGRTNLKKHVITHTGERKFICNHCGKSFGLKWTLDEHLRTHSSERPFACDQCSRAFKNIKDLRRHLIIHTGERPFKCWICGTAFRRKDNLDRHIKKTHNQPKEVAKQLANEAAAEYLKNNAESQQQLQNIPTSKINSVVIANIIKKNDFLQRGLKLENSSSNSSKKDHQTPSTSATAIAIDAAAASKKTTRSKAKATSSSTVTPSSLPTKRKSSAVYKDTSEEDKKGMKSKKGARSPSPNIRVAKVVSLQVQSKKRALSSSSSPSEPIDSTPIENENVEVVTPEVVVEKEKKAKKKGRKEPALVLNEDRRPTLALVTVSSPKPIEREEEDDEEVESILSHDEDEEEMVDELVVENENEEEETVPQFPSNDEEDDMSVVEVTPPLVGDAEQEDDSTRMVLFTLDSEEFQHDTIVEVNLNPDAGPVALVVPEPEFHSASSSTAEKEAMFASIAAEKEAILASEAVAQEAILASEAADRERRLTLESLSHCPISDDELLEFNDDEDDDEQVDHDEQMETEETTKTVQVEEKEEDGAAIDSANDLSAPQQPPLSPSCSVMIPDDVVSTEKAEDVADAYVVDDAEPIHTSSANVLSDNQVENGSSNLSGTASEIEGVEKEAIQNLEEPLAEAVLAEQAEALLEGEPAPSSPSRTPSELGLSFDEPASASPPTIPMQVDVDAAREEEALQRCPKEGGTVAGTELKSSMEIFPLRDVSVQLDKLCEEVIVKLSHMIQNGEHVHITFPQGYEHAFAEIDEQQQQLVTSELLNQVEKGEVNDEFNFDAVPSSPVAPGLEEVGQKVSIDDAIEAELLASSNNTIQTPEETEEGEFVEDEQETAATVISDAVPTPPTPSSPPKVEENSVVERVKYHATSLSPCPISNDEFCFEEDESEQRAIQVEQEQQNHLEQLTDDINDVDSFQQHMDENLDQYTKVDTKMISVALPPSPPAVAAFPVENGCSSLSSSSFPEVKTKARSMPSSPSHEQDDALLEPDSQLKRAVWETVDELEKQVEKDCDTEIEPIFKTDQFAPEETEGDHHDEQLVGAETEAAVAVSSLSPPTTTTDLIEKPQSVCEIKIEDEEMESVVENENEETVPQFPSNDEEDDTSVVEVTLPLVGDTEQGGASTRTVMFTHDPEESQLDTIVQVKLNTDAGAVALVVPEPEFHSASSSTAEQEAILASEAADKEPRLTLQSLSNCPISDDELPEFNDDDDEEQVDHDEQMETEVTTKTVQVEEKEEDSASIENANDLSASQQPPLSPSCFVMITDAVPSEKAEDVADAYVVYDAEPIHTSSTNDLSDNQVENGSTNLNGTASDIEGVEKEAIQILEEQVEEPLQDEQLEEQAEAVVAEQAEVLVEREPNHPAPSSLSRTPSELGLSFDEPASPSPPTTEIDEQQQQLVTNELLNQEEMEEVNDEFNFDAVPSSPVAPGLEEVGQKVSIDDAIEAELLASSNNTTITSPKAIQRLVEHEEGEFVEDEQETAATVISDAVPTPPTPPSPPKTEENSVVERVKYHATSLSPCPISNDEFCFEEDEDEREQRAIQVENQVEQEQQNHLEQLTDDINNEDSFQQHMDENLDQDTKVDTEMTSVALPPSPQNSPENECSSLSSSSFPKVKTEARSMPFSPSLEQNDASLETDSQLEEAVRETVDDLEEQVEEECDREIEPIFKADQFETAPEETEGDHHDEQLVGNETGAAVAVSPPPNTTELIEKPQSDCEIEMEDKEMESVVQNEEEEMMITDDAVPLEKAEDVADAYVVDDAEPIPTSSANILSGNQVENDSSNLIGTASEIVGVEKEAIQKLEQQVGRKHHHASYIFLPQRRYVHSRTGMLIKPGEDLAQDSDDDDNEVDRNMSNRSFDKLRILTPSEKEFMKLWGGHRDSTRTVFRGDSHMKQACLHFVKEHREELKRFDMRTEFMYHLINMCNYNIISRDEMADIVCKIGDKVN